jgi:hypothetical protein
MADEFALHPWQRAGYTPAGGEAMNENGRRLVERMFLEAAANPPKDWPRAPAAPATIHYTELAEGKPGEPLSVEWNHYRSVAGQLLAEGNEGRWVLVKNDQVLGIWDDREDATAAGYERFLLQPFLIHQVQERERLLRLGWRWL